MSDQGRTEPTETIGAATRTDASPVLDEAGRALFRLGRVFDKQRVRRVLAGQDGRSVELSRVLVVQAVEAALENPDREVTVGEVAGRLGVEPSTASRVVAETIRDGYLTRAASEADGRRIRLALTDAGRDLAENSRRYQRGIFERVTRDWSEEERREFARLFVKFAESAAETYPDRSDPDGILPR